MTEGLLIEQVGVVLAALHREGHGERQAALLVAAAALRQACLAEMAC